MYGETVGLTWKPEMLNLSKRLERAPIMGSMLLVAATPILMIVVLSVWIMVPQIRHANEQTRVSRMIELSTVM